MRYIWYCKTFGHPNVDATHTSSVEQQNKNEWTNEMNE